MENKIMLKDYKKNINFSCKTSLSCEEYMHLRKIAIDLIKKYHKNDIDKGGYPYINHLIRVSDGCEYYESRIAGLLHDIIEDTECDEQILSDAGIPDYIIEIILLVSRKENESYDDFIDRLVKSNNIFAMKLKCSDLRDNCDLSRLKNSPEEVIKKAKKRVEKRYMPSLMKIENKLKELQPFEEVNETFFEM